MSDEHIQHERRGKVGIVRLNRPDKLNAMTAPMLGQLAAHLQQMEADPEVRAIVVCGAGKSFCAGRDLSEVQDFHQQSAMTSLMDVFRSFHESHKVTMVVVQGYAMGFGCALAVHADLTVAEETAVLAMPEAHRGLPTFGPQPAFARALPHKVVLEMLLAGDRFDAQRAFQVGLVNRIAPSGKGMELALEWLDSFLDNDHGYIRDTKQALRMVRNLTDRDAMSYLVDKSSLHHAAGVGHQGIEAFNKA